MLEGGLGQLGNCRTVDLTDLKAKIIAIAVKCKAAFWKVKELIYNVNLQKTLN